MTCVSCTPDLECPTKNKMSWMDGQSQSGLVTSDHYQPTYLLYPINPRVTVNLKQNHLLLHSCLSLSHRKIGISSLPTWNSIHHHGWSSCITSCLGILGMLKPTPVYMVKEYVMNQGKVYCSVLLYLQNILFILQLT